MTQLPENPHSAKIQSTTRLSGDEVWDVVPIWGPVLIALFLVVLILWKRDMYFIQTLVDMCICDVIWEYKIFIYYWTQVMYV